MGWISLAVAEFLVEPQPNHYTLGPVFLQYLDGSEAEYLPDDSFIVYR